MNFPLSGRQVPEADDPYIREIIVQSYRTLYRVEPNRILMLAVMHASRDFTRPRNQAWHRSDDA